VGFRAGWGLGNALFIATSLAVIVGSASGGFAGAIVLCETALGIGIATGPLVGSVLGGISWRGPFFGVTILMAVALGATLVLVKKTPAPATRLSLTAPLHALRHRGLLTMGVTALLYNWGFFTVLGFAPFPMHLDTHQLGIAFTGWGVLVVDDYLARGAQRGVLGLRFRPVHRRRAGALLRWPDGRALGSARAVLRRRCERPGRDRGPVDRARPAPRR